MTPLSSQPTLLLTGPLGSGQTEVAIAYARAAHAAGRRVVLIDADIITPYFRVGDHRDTLEGEGIPVIAASGALASFELPAIPPQLRHALEPSDTHVVLDLGGDPEGARFLAAYAEAIIARGYDMWLVANPFRPATPDADSLVAAAHDLAAQSGLRFTGLVANPHLGPLTTPADILRGLAPIQRAASRLGLPVVLLALEPRFCADPSLPDLPPLPLALTLRLPW
jgi:hypothetical protein